MLSLNIGFQNFDNIASFLNLIDLDSQFWGYDCTVLNIFLDYNCYLSIVTHIQQSTSILMSSPFDFIFSLQILLVVISLSCVGIVLQPKNFLVAMFLIKVWCLKLISIDKGKTTVSILSFTFCLLQ